MNKIERKNEDRCFLQPRVGARWSIEGELTLADYWIIGTYEWGKIQGVSKNKIYTGYLRWLYKLDFENNLKLRRIFKGY